jgi:hypothetical protein
VGDAGTALSLPSGTVSFERFGTAERGSAERAWRIKRKGEELPWPQEARLFFRADGTATAARASGGALPRPADMATPGSSP